MREKKVMVNGQLGSKSSGWVWITADRKSVDPVKNYQELDLGAYKAMSDINSYKI